MNDLIWRKSSYSGGDGGECVEVAGIPDGRAVRDSKDRGGPMLITTVDQWAAFTDAISRGLIG